MPVVQLASPLFFCLLYFNPFLVHSAVLPSGRELETVEGPPVVPRLHGDENPARGSLVQPEETIADGQREEKKHKPPSGVTSPSNTTIVVIVLDLVYICLDIRLLPLVKMSCTSTLGQYVYS